MSDEEPVMSEETTTPQIAPPDYLNGGKRANLERSDWIDDWWVGYGKDDGCQFEGPWSHMAILAAKILSDPATEIACPNLYRPDLADALTLVQKGNYTESPTFDWPRKEGSQ